ncbi:MAG TPA: hypothetical protein DCX21_03490 [Eubacterium sp.]|nr:hypothetical protein [Eubacterium sp.]
MNIYDAVKFRYSNRRYKFEEIDEELYKNIVDYANNIVPVFRKAEFYIDFIKATSPVNYLTNYRPIVAPYYICFFTKTNLESNLNMGYVMQAFSIYLTSIGLASSFMRPTGIKLVEKDGLKPVLMMAFGKAKGLPYRDVKYAHRHALDRFIYKYDECDDFSKGMIDYGVLAPSRLNQQPWRFEKRGNDIDIYLYRRFDSYRKADEVSVGAVLCNMLLYAEEKWHKAKVELNRVTVSHFKNADYICSIVLDSE